MRRPCPPLPIRAYVPRTDQPTHREAIDALDLRRYCCRRMILTHVDLIEKLLKYVNSQGQSEWCREFGRKQKARHDRTG
jgi:DNA-directed RNA polymerase subunit N (RpoN/RPB10)